MQRLATRPWIAAGVALAAASVIVVAPVAPPLPDVSALDIQLAADEDMILDFVRHGQSTDNAGDILGTVAPGAGLTDTGTDQADALAQALYQEYGSGYFDGIFASQLLRTQDTAGPLADLLGHDGVPMSVQILPGLDEINAGIFEGQPVYSLPGLLYMLGPLSWAFGNQLMPIAGSTDINGIVFDQSFDAAVQAMYDAGGAPTDGALHNVAFSSAAAIATWALMNVKNPDFSIVLTTLLNTGQFLPNTGQVVVEGDPTDGWTLVSWDGTPVPAASLGTELFVDFRDLIAAPQTAMWQVWEALTSGDPTTIWPAVETGLDNVGAALLQFPESVFNDIVDAFNDGAPGIGADAVAALL